MEIITSFILIVCAGIAGELISLNRKIKNPDKDRYTYWIFHFSSMEIDEGKAVEKKEDEGWEVCGPINAPSGAWCGDRTTLVPMRRKRAYKLKSD